MKHTDQKQIRQAAAEDFQESLGELEAVFDAKAPSPETKPSLPTQGKGQPQPLRGTIKQPSRNDKKSQELRKARSKGSFEREATDKESGSRLDPPGE